MTTTSSQSQSGAHRGLLVTGLAAAVVLAFGCAFDLERTWSNLLVGTYFAVTLGLGAAVFLALTYITGAGWHVAFRRVPEALAMSLPLTGALIIVVLAMRMEAYGWSDSHAPSTLWFKDYWLTPINWLIRAGVYVVLWAFLSRWLIARSLRQDLACQPVSPSEGASEEVSAEEAEEEAKKAQARALRATAWSTRLSALFLIVYAATFSLASIDWMMALEPMWFSTIWGVYNFAGMIQASVAAVIILALVLRSDKGPLSGVFSDEHLHDLGKLLIGFSCFWMYIWFSQYMLIWYSNIPEETSYFISRINGPWGPVVVLSIILNWIVPFFCLLPRPAKRSGTVMMRVAIVVLIGRWVDLVVMVFPSTLVENGSAAHPVVGPLEISSVLLFGGLSAWLALRYSAQLRPVPTGDPYLQESLDYHAG